MTNAQKTNTMNPMNWTEFVTAAWREWREEARNHGEDSREARWAHARFMDCRASIEQDPEMAAEMARTAARQWAV